MTVFGAGVMLVKFPADDPDAWLRETYEYGEHVADQNWIRIIMDLLMRRYRNWYAGVLSSR